MDKSVFTFMVDRVFLVLLNHDRPYMETCVIFSWLTVSFGFIVVNKKLQYRNKF